MIRYLKGQVQGLGEGRVLLEVGGVGFLVEMPPSQAARLKEGEEAGLHVHLRLKEEGLSLYGFLDPGSLELFELLLGVNGVGPKVALSLLDLGPGLLAQALAQGDPKPLTLASGVGRKMAERVVLELKGRLPPHLLPSLPQELGRAAEEAILGLTALGFPEGRARAAVLEVLGQHPTARAQDLIKEALKRLR